MTRLNANIPDLEYMEFKKNVGDVSRYILNMVRIVNAGKDKAKQDKQIILQEITILKKNKKDADKAYFQKKLEMSEIEAEEEKKKLKDMKANKHSMDKAKKQIRSMRKAGVLEGVKSR